MTDEPLWSVRRIFNAFRLWLHFAALGDYTYPLWQYVRYYRRQAAAERDDTTFFVTRNSRDR